MSEFIRIDPRGAITPEDEASRTRLGEHTGRFYLAPTSPDLLVAVRAPCSGGSAAAPKVVLAGDVSGMPLADLVAFLNQSRTGGVLRVLSQAGERALMLKNGEVRGAASDDPADRLGEIAIRLGFVTRAQLEQVLAGRPAASRVGRALVEAGLLQPHDLYRCMQHQVSEIFHSILLTAEGAFMLSDQEVDDRGTLTLSTQGLLMDAIRRIDEMAEYRKRLPSSRAYVARRKPGDDSLEAEAHAVLDLCNGERTLAEIAQAARLTEFEATRILHHLIGGGYAAASPTPLAVAAEPPAPTTAQMMRVFNGIYHEILGEVRKVGVGTEFLAAANGALTGQSAQTPVLAGLSFTAEGTLCEAQLELNASRLGLSEAETRGALQAALSELMFFLLFETGELLDAAADDDLSRRVKQLLATIGGGQ